MSVLLTQRMDDSLLQHDCVLQLHAVLRPVSTRVITYHSLDVTVELDVPTVCCTLCDEEWEIDACEVGCFPSSPVTPHRWFDESLLNFYSHLTFSAGLSSTFYAGALEYVHQLAGQEVLIPDKAVRGTWKEYRRAARDVSKPESLGVTALNALGATRACAACAPVPAEGPRPAGSPAPPPHVPSYEPDADGRVEMVAVMMDAVAKLTHYRLQGASHAQIKATFNTYLGAVDSIVQAMAASGTLPNMREADVHLDPECHPALSCYHAAAKRGGILDVFGVAGMLCCHGQPLEGGFISMPTPEQSAFYDRLLIDMLLPERKVRDTYVDIACQYLRRFPRVAPAALLASAPRFRVPWMHARSHGRDCFLKNSGLYSMGSGRRIGEQSEQLWALLKNLGGISRYMALSTRRDFLDDAIGFIAEKKAAGFAILHLDKYRACVAQAGALALRVERLESYAGDAEFSLAELREAAAAQPVAARAQEHSDVEKMKIDYVRLHLEKGVLRQLRINGGAYAVALRGAAGRALHAKGFDFRRREQVAKLMGDLQERLGLAGPWPQESLDFQEAAGWLQQEEIGRLQTLIEDEVAKSVIALQQRVRGGPAGSISKNINDCAARRDKRVRDYVAQLQSWEGFDTSFGATVRRDRNSAGQLAVRWTEEAIGNLFASMFPWRAIVGSTAPLQLLASQYKECVAEVERTAEEQDLLVFEARQALLFYRFRRREFAAVIVATEDAAAALVCEVAAYVAQLDSTEPLDVGAEPLDLAAFKQCMQNLSETQAKVFLLRRVDAREEQRQLLAIRSFSVFL